MNCLYIIPDNDNHCILDDLFNTTVVETTDVFPLRKSHPISNVHCAHCRTGAKAGDGGGEGAESFSIHNTIFRKTVCIRYWVFLTVCVSVSFSEYLLLLPSFFFSFFSHCFSHPFELCVSFFFTFVGFVAVLEFRIFRVLDRFRSLSSERK